ncbi:hypothetical protein CH380_03280 [Leptospira adleri]|uniref:Uncharacterized protein n=1 Tax=Leptospira adleri TaxID=2023186 RepID=A0A2M9YT97_9LEPT|nr:hypothetical protein CH380_03280 [Leptospira adleri]PJZ60465.1 hypothetical protein CH376_18345 [Leptospira adleri]
MIPILERIASPFEFEWKIRADQYRSSKLFSDFQSKKIYRKRLRFSKRSKKIRARSTLWNWIGRNDKTKDASTRKGNEFRSETKPKDFFTRR